MDGILGVGPLELIIIVVLALVILGPERLPDTIRQVARFIRHTRAIGNELTSQFSEELRLLDDFNPKKILEDVAGLDEDDDFDAKSVLGIDKDDLKLEPTDLSTNSSAKKLPSKASESKKPTNSAASASTKRSKPALGESDPEETSAVDAVKEKPNESATNGSTPTVPKTNSGDDSADVSAISDTDKKQVEPVVAAADSVDENRIAPPNMTDGPSLAAEQKLNNDTIATVVEKTVSESTSDVSSDDEKADTLVAGDGDTSEADA